MRISAVHLAAVLLALSMGCNRSSVKEPPLPETAMLHSATVEVPMNLETGRPIVEVMIEGQGPYAFILDTGASATVVDEKLAEELGLAVVGDTRIGDPTNPEAIPAKMVRAGSVRMGGVELSGVTAVAMPVRRMMGERYGGVFGFPHLGEFLVTLDYPRRRVILTHGELAAGAPGVTEFSSEGCLIALPMRVAGEPLKVHLDSGNPGSFMLPRALSEKWKFKSEPVEVGMAGTVNSMTAIYRAQVDGEIEVAGLTYPDPEVMLSDLLAEWANMGFDALQDVVLTVDQKNHRLRMERVEGVERRPARRRVGVAFAGMTSMAAGLPIKDGALEVGMVAPGSPAEAAGIKVGDLILAVNDRPVADLDPDSLFQAFGSGDPLRLEIRRAGEILTLIVR